MPTFYVPVIIRALEATASPTTRAYSVPLTLARPLVFSGAFKVLEAVHSSISGGRLN